MQHSTRDSACRRDGFTLVEVVVAIAILAAVLVMLAGMTFATAQRAVDLQSAGARQALMLQEINRLSALSLADLDAQGGCRTLASGADAFTSCVSVAVASARTRQVIVVLTPARAGARPDTVGFTRTEPSTTNPFNCPGC
ncbi:MAG TPA: prepilin-type N-terminal cleavage/methylation domain-containing protein [Longimicrobiales bacterium]|nr:prepilin-type N-terminal cleavage/methylation domain-containing protein [Longimicrobiales bacterium]